LRRNDSISAAFTAAQAAQQLIKRSGLQILEFTAAQAAQQDDRATTYGQCSPPHRQLSNL